MSHLVRGSLMGMARIPTLTGRMKSLVRKELNALLLLLYALIDDMVSAFPAYNSKEARRDKLTLARRAEHEGLAFITSRLASFGRSIDRSLATGHPLAVDGFATNGHLPKLLGTMLALVFSADGTVLAKADAVALRYIRQFFLILSKYEMDCNPTRLDEIQDEFIRTDNEAGQDWPVTDEILLILRRARSLVHRVLANADPSDIVPGHGPGAVATGQQQNEKMVFDTVYSLTETCYPFHEYYFYSLGHYCDRMDGSGKHAGLRAVVEERVPLSRGVFVPKDYRGPRFISMEPLGLQWLQQGQKDLLYRTVEGHPLTRGRVNFLDQSVNQRLALSSSFPGSPYVTLDMKDASDRVSLRHLYRLFPSNWVKAIMATRSHGTVLPRGDTVIFNKVAPMGSAVCFPIEALVFWSLCQATVDVNAGPRRSVYVYGDDLVVPRKFHSDIVHVLTVCGLAVNSDKCCTGTPFRESCGVDAFMGINVTPFRLKRRYRGGRHTYDISAIAAFVDLSNHAYCAGYWRLAQEIETSVRTSFLRLGKRRRASLHAIPTVSTVSPGIVSGRSDDSSSGGIAFARTDRHGSTQPARLGRYRWNNQLHRLEVQVWATKPKVRRAIECGWELMLYHLRHARSARRVLDSSIVSGIAIDRDGPDIIPARRQVSPMRRWIQAH